MANSVVKKYGFLLGEVARQLRVTTPNSPKTISKL